MTGRFFKCRGGMISVLGSAYNIVIPAKAGIQHTASAVCMGHVRDGHRVLDSGFRRNDSQGKTFRFLYILLTLIFLCALPTNVQAACSSPAGGAGDILYNTDHHVVQYCNNTNWMSVGTPNTGGCGGCTCSSPAGAQGTILYNTDFHVLQYCNGTNWIAMGQAGSAGGSSAEGRVSTGNLHTCGILADSTLRCWGFNDTTQLGDNTSSTRLTPTAVNGGGAWQRVSSGNRHTCGIKADDTLWCWGENLDGQIGDNTVSGTRPVPTAVNGGGAWKQVSAGGFNTCGIKNDDTLWCWGRNNVGQLGDNTSGTNRLIPTAVSGGGAWKQVSAGSGHACGIKSDDTLWCWGGNTYGNIGDNTSGTDRLVPTAVSGGGSWKQVSASGFHTCGIKTDDSLWCWGWNDSGRLGDNSTTQRLIPTAVSGGGAWKQTSAGGNHTCGIKTDDSSWCWGRNTYGNIGDSTSGTDRLVPTAVSGGGTWKQIGAGGDHTCGIRNDGLTMCWGRTAQGQLGNNTTSPDQLSPVVLVDPGAGGPPVQTFDASGTWYKPTGYSSTVDIECWGSGGGGGGGGGGSTTQTAGGGGGSGAHKTVNVAIGTLGATETVTIGAAGTGGAGAVSGGGAGTNGTAGGNSVFGSVVTANGGGFGGGGAASGSTQGTGGAGGTCAGCTAGGNGAASTGTGATAASGAGGNAPVGGGTGGASEAYTGSAGTPGNPGGAPGAGGGGGGAGKTGNPAASKAGGIGGAGASGRCVATANGTTTYVGFLTQGWLGSGCSSPTGVEGSVLYNTDHNKPQFCNGTLWSTFGP